MTEKRYKRLVSSIDYYYCIDTNDDKGLTEEDMLNLLNEQDERIKKLSEENEQLKKDLKKKFVPFAKADGDYTTVSTEEFIKILNENEQLKEEKERYKRLSEIRNENINNRILSLKEFINNCENEKVKNALEDLFYSEVKEYDLAKENRELKKEVKRLKCINKQLEDRLGRDIALNMDCVEAIEDWENECKRCYGAK